MPKDQIDERVVVLDDPDNWVEFFEEDGHPAVRVLPEFVGERLIMTEQYRHKMIDNLRTTAPDPDSRKNPEWVVRLTIDALGVKVIPDVNRIGSRCSGQQLTAVASSKAAASDSRVGKSQEWRIFRTILGRR